MTQHFGDHTEVWRRARGLADVGELMALWLEGRLPTRPGYEQNYGPDDETRELVPVLSWMNRSGFLTQNSQPGHDWLPGWDKQLWRQRASVDGFLRNDLVHEVTARLTQAGLVVIVGGWHHNTTGLVSPDGRINVTERTTRRNPSGPTTRTASLAVAPQRPPSVSGIFDLCSPAVHADIARNSTYFVALDPQWGDNRRLWHTFHQTFEQINRRAHAQRAGARQAQDSRQQLRPEERRLVADKAREIAEHARRRQSLAAELSRPPLQDEHVRDAEASAIRQVQEPASAREEDNGAVYMVLSRTSDRPSDPSRSSDGMPLHVFNTRDQAEATIRNVEADQGRKSDLFWKRLEVVSDSPAQAEAANVRLAYKMVDLPRDRHDPPGHTPRGREYLPLAFASEDLARRHAAANPGVVVERGGYPVHDGEARKTTRWTAVARADASGLSAPTRKDEEWGVRHRGDELRETQEGGVVVILASSSDQHRAERLALAHQAQRWSQNVSPFERSREAVSTTEPSQGWAAFGASLRAANAGGAVAEKARRIAEQEQLRQARRQGAVRGVSR